MSGTGRGERIANRSQESAVSGTTGMGHQASSASMVLHEAIIDLYLQVKVRSNDEVSLMNDRIQKIIYKQNYQAITKYKYYIWLISIIILNCLLSIHYLNVSVFDNCNI